MVYESETSPNEVNVKGKAKSRSSHAGLQFLVDRIHWLMYKGNYAEQVAA